MSEWGMPREHAEEYLESLNQKRSVKIYGRVKFNGEFPKAGIRQRVFNPSDLGCKEQRPGFNYTFTPGMRTVPIRSAQDRDFFNEFDKEVTLHFPEGDAKNTYRQRTVRMFEIVE